MDDSTLTKDQLAGLLREAERPHGEYERPGAPRRPVAGGDPRSRQAVVG